MLYLLCSYLLLSSDRSAASSASASTSVRIKSVYNKITITVYVGLHNLWL